MDIRWILAANAGRARVFRQPDATAPLEEVDDLVNEAVRLSTADTESDGLGRRSSTTGSARGGTPSQASGYEPHRTPAEHQADVFARYVAGYLRRQHQAGRFRALSLTAAPEFLGLLRKELDAELSKAVELEIDKDYTQQSAKELAELVRKHRMPA